MSSLFKKSEDDYCEKGLAALHQRRLALAEAEFSQGLQAYPKSFALYVNRSNVWVHAGDYVRAAADLTAALEAGPQNSGAWAVQLKRGTCYVRTNQMAEAMRDLDATLAAPPRHAQPELIAQGHFYRALALMEVDVPRALADAKKAVELEPNNRNYRKLIAELEVQMGSPEVMKLGEESARHLQSGQYDQALESLHKLLQLEPNHAKAWQMKGLALHQLERYEEELVALNTSYQLNGNEVALFNRAVCHIALERLPEAVDDLSRFLEIGTHASSLQRARQMLAVITSS